MSQASSGFTPDEQVPHRFSKGPSGYVFTEEEKRVFKECSTESFWYRSLPFSAIAIGATHVMLTKGIISPSPRFGSLPKIAFAGVFGYIAGKMSYTGVCQEKFLKLDNSPVGEAIRQGRMQPMPSQINQSGFPNPSESQESGVESAFQSTTEVSSMAESYRSYTSDYTYSRPSQSYDPTPFSSGFSDSGPSNIRGDIPYQGTATLAHEDEDVPKKKPVLYEELRSKNRENYEITLPQKVGSLIKPQTEVTPKKEVKKNKYGDSWEE